MSDVNPLVLLALAALLVLVAYAAFQFRRLCQEHNRRGQQNTAPGERGPNNSDRPPLESSTSPTGRARW